MAIAFFADELLPYFGIKGKVVGYAPTEVVHLEVKRFLQDFNLVMDDGSWKHFEFQSKNEGRIHKPVTELREGVSIYRIVPIIMRDKNADRVISGLRQKVDKGIH